MVSISPGHLCSLIDMTHRSGPAYPALAEALRNLIVDGRVVPGTRLPSERSLAEALGLSRTTVTAAYTVLRDRGYATARQGSGTVVRLPRSSGQPIPSTGPIVPGERVEQTADLAVAALPAPPGTAGAYEAVTEDLPGILAGTGYHPLGYEPLRRALAARYEERGLSTHPDQIIITNGALSATALIATALVRPGDRVVVENPSYPNSVQSLRNRGARLSATVVEPAGWDIAALAGALRTGPRLAMLTPDFHNPTGACMSGAERHELSRAAVGTTVVVDETLVEFPGAATGGGPPFACFAPAITVGSASKSHWGGLRIGWIRVPDDEQRPGLLALLARTRLSLDLGAAPIEQAVLHHLLADDTVVPHQRRRVAAGRAALIETIAAQLPGWRVHRPDGGLSLWCELPGHGPDADTVATLARRAGVSIGAGPRFSLHGGHCRFVRLACTLTPEASSAAVHRMSSALSGLDPRRPTTASPRPVLV